ncbi:hypothetical protein A3K86_02125 [Photobacterium jeanii]|uniref:EAL domain-containing protein n=1 Tax=Photobacterium jeanii TaxID=858640 RepID=A0A178KK91_9GAMM|nr:EAL domain-containing protein [Photobacterium jeanii]OAN17739.1 hypothetical protein A3K86_02125 [Photobacterium jeanii]PST92599.1 EAL domain-containing protein [Photobacterium jeanii]
MHKIHLLDVPNTVRITSLQDERDYVDISFLLQPIVEPANGEVVAYEALSKVLTQEGEQLNNELFFEQLDDEFLKALVLAQIKAFKQSVYKQRRVLISYNLSLSCMNDECFIDTLLGTATQKIALEFTNLDTNIRSKRLLANLQKVQKKGHQLWLDDYLHQSKEANLTLGNIEWDIIKIDKSYLFFNTKEESLLESLTTVLQSYVKKGLVFEGVETELQRRLICGHRVYAQGYYFSYPRSVEDAISRTYYSPWNTISNESRSKKQHRDKASLPTP